MNKDAREWLQKNRAVIMDGWSALLRHESVSADASKLGACERCAQSLGGFLSALGFRVETALFGSEPEMDGAPPLVFAERPAAGGSGKTLLIYGHYDVQPASMADGWSAPPFEPVFNGGRLYARGAQDNKGQLWWTLQAVRHAVESGAPAPRIKIILDGQEECGSPALIKACELLERSRSDALAADALLVSDTSACADGRPALIAGLRGVSMISFRLRGAAYDLHSGAHGGVAPNPAAAMAKIIAEMHDEGGGTAVPGFMSGAGAPGGAETAIAMAAPFDAEEYEAATGVAPCGGMRGYAPQVRAALLPTIEVNGLHSGYGGEGGKTIIPASAEVKISCRTVPGQTPQGVLDALRAHFKRHAPHGMRLEEVFSETGACALRLDASHPMARLALGILNGMDPRGAAVVYEGASIHAIGALAALSGAAPLLVGFGAEEDRIHAADESYSIGQAEKNFFFASELLAAMSK